MGVAALVLGIVAIVIGAVVPTAQWIGAIVGIIGIVLGAVGKKKEAPLGTGGLVCSIIGFVLCIILYIACIGCVGGLASMF